MKWANDCFVGHTCVVEVILREKKKKKKQNTRKREEKQITRSGDLASVFFKRFCLFEHTRKKKMKLTVKTLSQQQFSVEVPDEASVRFLILN